MLYYSEYYALYSFLSGIGVKCENHECSIAIAAYLVGENVVSKINTAKQNRINAQYYLKIKSSSEIEENMENAKTIIAAFENTLDKLSEDDISDYIDRLNKAMK
jgi:uncharacterized protein (UPF0332 family)